MFRLRLSRGLKTFTSNQAQTVDAPIQYQTPKALAKSRIAQIDSERPPVSPFLIDSFRRRHDYLRISLTERCNLRCFYCMPEEGVELSPNGKILTDDEVVRLATLFVRNGVTKIRLTGGEPTVRKGLVELVGRLNELRKHGLKSIGMTTNGIVLHRRLPALVQNGLTHLNISLDTLDPFKFEIMTRRLGHEAVLKSIDAALASSELRSVKLNVVVIKGLNDREVFDFIEMTKHQDLSVRFIEFMPFTGNKWDKGRMLPSSELLARITEKHPLVMKASDELNDTARNYLIPGYRGSFGFISSMSDHFCGSCNRLRLTADGQIKVCLFDAKEISLRDQMRQGVSDEELMYTIGRAVGGKKEKHAGMEDIDVVTNRPMILIGGIRPAQRVQDIVHMELIRRGAVHRSTRALGTAKANSAERHASELRSLGLLNTYFRWHRKIPQLQHIPSQLLHARFTSNSTSGVKANSAERDLAQTRPVLTHIDETGRPVMVDVSAKVPTQRTATASGRIYIPKIAYDLITVPTEHSEGSEHHSGEDAAAKSETRDGAGSSLRDTAARQSAANENASFEAMQLERAKAKARAKGDVLTVAQLAAIMGCKRTSDLIPLCHPLSLTKVSVRLIPEFHPSRRPRADHPLAARPDVQPPEFSDAPQALHGVESQGVAGPRSGEDTRPSQYSVMCQATVSCEGKTGVEMEALTAVSVGLLTVWDMLKAVAGKEMVIGEVVVESKEGGKSGDFVRTHVKR